MLDERDEDLVQRLESVLPVRARRMFGGVGLDHDGVFFALVHTRRLYFRVDDATREQFERAGSRPFRPFAGRPHVGGGYWEVPDPVLTDASELARWAKRAVAAARARKEAAPRAKARRTSARTRRRPGRAR